MPLCSLLLRVALACCLLHSALCRHSLILVSCDGFRYDYLDWFPQETAFLRGLIPRGVHIQRMTTAFSTKTFPNHWTIATGLYQESHGILSNNMYDPKFNATFNKGTREERWWNASMPIWITAKLQGLKSATFFWPGSEVRFNGVRQDYYYEYNQSISFEFRVQKVLDWITKEGVNLATLYIDQPDSVGHKFGPRSEQVREALRKVDSTLQLLFQGLKERKFTDKVNVLIVSDHGMAAVHDNKVINLGTSLDIYTDRILDSGPLLSLNAKPGKKQELFDFLENEVRTKKLAMRVFTKESLPERYHYRNNRRTPDVLVLPDQGYFVITAKDKPLSKGNHGFDNEYSNMKVPMFAVGPSFRKNVQIVGFRQVDIYGLICHLLDIRPQPNNGSLALLPMMLNAAATKKVEFLSWLGQLASAILLGISKRFLFNI